MVGTSFKFEVRVAEREPVPATEPRPAEDAMKARSEDGFSSEPQEALASVERRALPRLEPRFEARKKLTAESDQPERPSDSMQLTQREVPENFTSFSFQISATILVFGSMAFLSAKS